MGTIEKAGGRREGSGREITCSRLSVSCQWRIGKAGRRRVGSGREKGEISFSLPRIPLAADPACRPLAFSIVLTEREPGTG